MLHGLLDGELTGFLGRLAMFEMVFVLCVFRFDRRRASLRMTSGRRPAHRQNRSTQRDLVGPPGSQRRLLGALEVALQTPIEIGGDERCPDSAAFPED